MLDTRLHDWLARVPRNGPWLVSLALAALIAVELARIALTFLGGAPVQTLSPAPARNREPPHASVNVEAIAAAHLFGIALADPAVQDPANAPASTANLVLTGTVATQDPKHGMAIISDGGPAKVFSVGENVGGAALHSVYLDHVILNRDGSLETLALPRQALAGQPPVVRRTVGADARTAAVENIRRLVQQDPAILSEVMRTVASYDNKAGKLRGFRAYPGRNRMAFSRLGLKPGDLVTAINGTPLDDPQRSQDVLNTIQSSDRATVTIERGGQTQEITLDIGQVAVQAGKDLEGDSGAPATPTGSLPSLPSGAMPGAPPGALPRPPGENVNE